MGRKKAGSDDEVYRSRIEKDNARKAELSASARDIASEYPELSRKSIARRNRCRSSLKKFCETYNPEAFYLGWSADHIRAMERIEEAAQLGALYAFAMPRGSGKTSLCRMAALWAISYGYCRYVFIIGANASKAEDNLAAIKIFIRFLSKYIEDFPEISYPVVKLGGVAHKAHGQTCRGNSTMIGWGKERIILPTMPPPKGWPQSWKVKDDGTVPTSGAVIGTSGLTGEGIRGSVLTLTTGEQVRPDLVLLDDPQTDDSARSLTQNAEREQLISAGVLGMAGPGKSISAVMPCTVIQVDDMVDRLLDRKRHPLWRGERTKLLKEMPKDLSVWEPYLDLYRKCAQKEPPDYTESNDYYRVNQSLLERGFEGSWPERKQPGEVSAIQSAMHIYARDPRAFYSEYQNDPIPLEPPLPGDLTAEQIASRTGGTPRGVAPVECGRVTAFIDVQQDLLFWCIAGWNEQFGGCILDYGTYPDQRRGYFSLREANPTLADATGVRSLEGSLHAGLTTLTNAICTKDWPTNVGSVIRVERLLIDAGWGQSTEVIKRFVRSSPHAGIILPSYGRGITASTAPIGEWGKQEGERKGLNWVIRQGGSGASKYLIYDANYWKSFLFSRLSQPVGEPAALVLFGTEKSEHRLFADHLVAEYRVRTEGRGRQVEEWKWRPHRPDNHWLDCAAGCCVAASTIGVALKELPATLAGGTRRVVSYATVQQQQKQERPAQQPAPTAEGRKRISYREMQQKARARR